MSQREKLSLNSLFSTFNSLLQPVSVSSMACQYEFVAALIAYGFSLSTPLQESSNQLKFPFSLSPPIQLTVFRCLYRSSLSLSVCSADFCSFLFDVEYLLDPNFGVVNNKLVITKMKKGDHCKDVGSLQIERFSYALPSHY